MEQENLNKWRYSLITTILIVLILNPYVIGLITSLIKYTQLCKLIKCSEKIMGTLIGLVLFTIVIRYAMDLNL